VDGRHFKDLIFEQFARAGAALGSPKRIEIVDLLIQAGRTVESIADATGMTVANTSRHLQVLRHAGMVTTSRVGNYVHYRISDESVVASYTGLRALAESQIAEVSQLAQAFFGPVDGTESLEMEELLSRSKSGEVVVIDVRPRLEFDSGHIPGALSIALDELSHRLSELDSNTSVVAYCRGPYCVLAAEAVRQLRQAGIPAERYAGGPPEWRAAGIAKTSSSTSDSSPTRVAHRKNTKQKGTTK
jgi:rhodanese-related sulfurtransferase